jgi:hypothetical protein
MPSGLNENVALYGRTFHVQTEMMAGVDEPKIETTVFLEGRVVGYRALPVTEGESAEEQLAAQMSSQHTTIVESLVNRLADLQARRREERPEPAAPEEPVPVAEPAAGEELALPDPDASFSLASATKARMLFGRFRGSIDFNLPTTPDELATCMETTGNVIVEIADSPYFPEIRVDDQVRFNVFKERINEWLIGNRDYDKGFQIWSDVLTFSANLSRINQRSVLRTFDQQLLAWAVHTISEEGMSADAHSHLQSLYGTDRDLDRMLESPGNESDECWLEILQRLLDDLRQPS